MVKRISRIGFAVLFGMSAAAIFYADFAQASGVYKLEHSQGWGCCCIPNVGEFGYFRTEWREWPGEIRRDKTFPRSIGMEAIPAPEGQVIVPLPRITVPPKGPGETQPEPGTEEGTEKPSEGLPSDKMPEQGKETPDLPGLPTEPGGINLLPGLPTDLGPSTLPIPKAQEENVPNTEPKADSEPKTDNPEPGPKPEDKGTRVKSPVNSTRISRLDPVGQSSNIVRAAAYQEPEESPMAASISRSIVAQSYQSPGEMNDDSAVIRSEAQIGASSNDSRRDTLPVAVDGFCPVELSLHGRWVQGDPRWTVVYKGFIYRLSGNVQRQEFIANPEKFTPANGGFDPVVSVTQRRNVPGQVNFCATYKGRIYMFSGAATQDYFRNNPEPYAIGAVK
jgi:YHS domain-containing protein